MLQSIYKCEMAIVNGEIFECADGGGMRLFRATDIANVFSH